MRSPPSSPPSWCANPLRALTGSSPNNRCVTLRGLRLGVFTPMPHTRSDPKSPHGLRGRGHEGPLVDAPQGGGYYPQQVGSEPSRPGQHTVTPCRWWLARVERAGQAGPRGGARGAGGGLADLCALLVRPLGDDRTTTPPAKKRSESSITPASLSAPGDPSPHRDGP
jgi:hypothetical protein